MGKSVIESPIPVVFKQILKKKISGELFVESNEFKKKMFFIQGNLAFAQTSVIQERLGEILFKIGKINQDQFLDIKYIVQDKTERLGKKLIDLNILTERDLFFGLLFQVRTIATSVFSLSSGQWDFRQCEPDLPDDSKFGIELPGIIFDGIESAFNFSYYKNRLNHLAPQVERIEETVKSHVSVDDINFINELKRYTNTPNSKVGTYLKMSDNDYWKKIIYYYLLNIISFAETEIDKELDKNIEELIELFELLKKNALNHYEIFKLKIDSDFDDIKTAYFDYAKKFHPDRVADAPDPDIKDKANFVFGAINKAYETLSNADKRTEYDTKVLKGEAAEESNENLVEKARILYRKAITLNKNSKYWEAVNLLDEAVRLDDSKPAYYLLLGTCQMNLPTLRRAAQQNFEQAQSMEPWNPEPAFRMGMMFEKEQQYQRAEGFYRKALSINPSHAMAKKKLDQLTSKGKKKSRFSIFGKKK